MIKAGIYFLLERVSSLTKEKILKMPYPEFRDMVCYYADPKAYLETTMTKEDVQERISDIKDKLEQF